MMYRLKTLQKDRKNEHDLLHIFITQKGQTVDDGQLISALQCEVGHIHLNAPIKHLLKDKRVQVLVSINITQSLLNE